MANIMVIDFCLCCKAENVPLDDENLCDSCRQEMELGLPDPELKGDIPF